MRWLAHYSDGSVAEAGPGRAVDRSGMSYLECEGYRVATPEGARVVRLERHSTGGSRWSAGIIAVGEELHVVTPRGVLRQRGWGTDVLTGPPLGGRGEL